MPVPDSANWTLIPVMYRDAHNYKAYGDILLEGIITDTQIEAIRTSLREKTHYVPGQLGLGHLAHQAWPGSTYDDDDNWHEMFLSEIRRVNLADAALIDPPRRVWRVLPLGRMGTWDRSHRGGIQTS